MAIDTIKISILTNNHLISIIFFHDSVYLMCYIGQFATVESVDICPNNLLQSRLDVVAVEGFEKPQESKLLHA